ncbi:MAG: protein kinase, partial [Gemmatimonadota bacterium]
MTVDPNQWQLLKAAFDELNQLVGEARAARLERLAKDDASLHAELVGLLAASDSVGDRFESGAALAVGLATPAAGLAGQHIDHWQVVREIGHGGMGAVYEAHRSDDQYTKRVAIKTIAAGRGSEALLRRFRHERQILARLEHPNIATLLD